MQHIAFSVLLSHPALFFHPFRITTANSDPTNARKKCLSGKKKGSIALRNTCWGRRNHAVWEEREILLQAQKPEVASLLISWNYIYIFTFFAISSSFFHRFSFRSSSALLLLASFCTLWPFFSWPHHHTAGICFSFCSAWIYSSCSMADCSFAASYYHHTPAFPHSVHIFCTQYAQKIKRALPFLSWSRNAPGRICCISAEISRLFTREGITWTQTRHTKDRCRGK